MASHQIVLPEPDEWLKAALEEERKINTALDAIKSKSKPLKARKTVLTAEMLKWARDHQAPIGIDIHVVGGKSIGLAESFTKERVNEESLDRILTLYFQQSGNASLAQAAAAAKNVVTFYYDHLDRFVSTRLTIKDAVASMAKKRAAAEAAANGDAPPKKQKKAPAAAAKKRKPKAAVGEP